MKTKSHEILDAALKRSEAWEQDKGKRIAQAVASATFSTPEDALAAKELVEDVIAILTSQNEGEVRGQ